MAGEWPAPEAAREELGPVLQSHHEMHPQTDREEMLRRIVISIDGPAGSGKTTTARGVAAGLSLRHIDTGAMYRAVTRQVLAAGIDPGDESRVGGVAGSTVISFARTKDGADRITADGVDVTEAIRSLEVTSAVSLVSSYAAVRKAMVRIQRRLAAGGGVVLEGRDIGTVVLPGAHVKVFLLASVEERARRRLKELERTGVSKTLEEIRLDIERRDRLDSGRELSPLKKPIGAHVVDTTNMSIEGQIARIIEIARETSSWLASRIVVRGARNPHATQRRVYALSCAMIRFAGRTLFGLEVVKKDGHELRENYIYACNHRSNADPPIVGATIGREVYFMAKENLFRSRFMSRLISYYNAIPTRRESFDRKAFDKTEEVLKRGGSVLIFPEGTRSHGEALGEGKPGVGYLALKTGVPVVPLYATGTGRLMEALRRRHPLIVAYGDPIRTANGESVPPSAENCREFTEMVMAAIEALRDEIESQSSRRSD